MSDETALQVVVDAGGAGAVLEAARSELEPLLEAAGIPVALMYEAALSQFTKTPLLAKCTQVSIIRAVKEAAQCGLTFAGGKGYLVPFYSSKNRVYEAVFIPGYQGFVDLVQAHPAVLDVRCEAVYDDEEFDLELGAPARIRHRRNLQRGSDEDLDRIVGYYMAATMAGGVVHPEWMSVKDVRRLKAQALAKLRNDWQKDASPWRQYEVDMGRKSVLRKGQKFLPNADPRLIYALQYDDRQYDTSARTIDGETDEDRSRRTSEQLLVRPAGAGAPVPASHPGLAELEALGSKLFGDDWKIRSSALARASSSEEVQTLDRLSEEQIDAALDHLRTRMERRLEEIVDRARDEFGSAEPTDEAFAALLRLWRERAETALTKSYVGDAHFQLEACYVWHRNNRLPKEPEVDDEEEESPPWLEDEKPKEPAEPAKQDTYTEVFGTPAIKKEEPKPKPPEKPEPPEPEKPKPPKNPGEHSSLLYGGGERPLAHGTIVELRLHGLEREGIAELASQLSVASWPAASEEQKAAALALAKDPEEVARLNLEGLIAEMNQHMRGGGAKDIQRSAANWRHRASDVLRGKETLYAQFDQALSEAVEASVKRISGQLSGGKKPPPTGPQGSLL